MPIIKMNVIPKEILLGDSIVFSWNITNAKKILLKPANDTLEATGSYTFKPNKDSIFTRKFVAVAGKNKTSKFYTIKVLSPEIKGEVPKSVTDEEEFEVSWSSSNADYVMVSGCIEKLPLKGKQKIKADSTEKVIFTSYNKFGKSSSRTYPLNVKYIEDLQFPEQLVRGDSCYISWKYKKSKKVIVEDFDSTFHPIDSICVKPDSSKEYVIKVIRNNGDTTVEKALINVVDPRLLSFSAPGYIFKGDEATLKWTSQLIPSVNIEGIKDSLPPNGFTNVKPDKTTTYRLSSNANSGKQSLTACVNVITRKLVVNSKSIKDVSDKIRFDFEIFSTDFTNYPNSVKLYVLVVDTLGNFITDLAPPYGTKEMATKYFKGIVESTSTAKNQRVQSFDVKEVHEKTSNPMDVNITMDYSGSMSGTTSSLEYSCNLFINKMPENTRLSMIRFSDTIVKLCDLTDNKIKLLKQVPLTKKDTFYFGGTALYAAMDEGLISLINSPNPKQMFAFTDGCECSSFAYFGKRATFAQQVAIKAKSNNIRVNSIGFGSGVNEKLLKFLAIITGGSYYFISNPSDIVKVIDESLYINSNYYVITYKPMVKDKDRKITLIYNANNGKTGNTNRDAFVGNKFDFQELEYESGTYNYSTPKKSWGTRKPVSMPQSVANFEFAKSNFNPVNAKKIAPFIAYLKNKPDAKIVVYGHADHVGNEEDCENLSKQRAESIKKYLMDNGIPDSQIIIEPCGKKYPIWKTEDTKWKAAENRRVELLIIE